MSNTPVDVEGLIKSIESMNFNSEKDVEMLKVINKMVEEMLVYAMTLNLSNGK